MLSLLVLSLASAGAPVEEESGPADDRHHLSLGERHRFDTASRRAAAWLLSRQDETGAFRALEHGDLSPVILTSLPLWALSVGPLGSSGEVPALRACAALFRYRREGGGIYRPESGLAVEESLAARAALRAFSRRWESRQVERFLEALDRFLEAPRGRGSQDAPGSSRKLQEVAGRAGELSDGERKAVDFLKRLRADGAPRGGARQEALEHAPAPARCSFLAPLSASHPAVERSLHEIQAGFDLEQPPALAKHFSDAGLLPPVPGPVFGYFLMAAVLATRHDPYLELESGRRADWPRELAGRLLELQEDDGSWRSPAGSGRLDPLLETSCAVLALAWCRESLERAPRARD